MWVFILCWDNFLTRCDWNSRAKIRAHIAIEESFICFLSVCLSLSLSIACVMNCGTHGQCKLNKADQPTCECDFGWSGLLCDRKLCDPRCFDHGHCTNGTCVCHTGWNGKHCTLSERLQSLITGWPHLWFVCYCCCVQWWLVVAALLSTSMVTLRLMFWRLRQTCSRGQYFISNVWYLLTSVSFLSFDLFLGNRQPLVEIITSGS